MAIGKASQKPRSQTTSEVFDVFIEKLRDAPDLGEAIAERMEAALAPGQTINAVTLKEALFPAEETVAD